MFENAFSKFTLLFTVITAILALKGYMTWKGYFKYATILYVLMAVSDIVIYHWNHFPIDAFLTAANGFFWWKNRKDDDWTNKGNKPKWKRSRSWVPKLKNPEAEKSLP